MLDGPRVLPIVGELDRQARDPTSGVLAGLGPVFGPFRQDILPGVQTLLCGETPASSISAWAYARNS